MQEKNSKKSYIFAALTVIFWSTVASAFKIGLREVSPAVLLFYSSLTSTIFFSLLLFNKKSYSKIFTIKHILNSVLLGFINPFLYYLILFEAYKLLPAQIAQPLNYSWVIVVTIMMSVLFKQKLNLSSILSLFISFSGVIILSSQRNIHGIGEINLFGVFLALSSSIFWALYWLLNLKDKREDIPKMFLNFFFGTIFILIYIFLTEGFTLKIKGILPGIYIGIFEMGLTFYVWLKALKYSENTAKTSNIIYLTPFISLVFISIILGESISYYSTLGLMLIIAGILFPRLIKTQTY
jgi:drug/metabolite transporter (DMT)-like permease